MYLYILSDLQVYYKNIAGDLLWDSDIPQNLNILDYIILMIYY